LKSKTPLRSAVIIFTFLLSTAAGYAHGTEYEVLPDGAVAIRATYDTGQPIAHAAVLVFAPGETTPLFETITDNRGIVCFLPDRIGTWILQVRGEGGHGMRINLEVDENMLPLLKNGKPLSRISVLQKIIIAVCVCWGLIGTAFFIKSRIKGKV
jgi:nickel transport protein